MSPRKKIVAGVMKGMYIATYPITSSILHNSRRVRVVVTSKNQILLQRSHLGLQKWSLPGGGINKNETALQAAKRETYEETNVALKESDLGQIGFRRLPPKKRWPSMDITFFSARLKKPEQPKVTHKFEIMEVKWFKLDDLPKKRSPTVDIGLQLLLESKETVVI